MSETPVKWTAAGLTPAGNALQAALLGTGDGLTFTRAAAADAEGVERLDLTLQAPCMVEGPKCRVPVLLTNAGVETGFTMTELRFYVRRVTDGAPTGEEVLYATVTDETGDPIPTAAQSPGFTIDWAFVFQFGNASEVTVTLDPVGLVSIGMVGQPNGVAGLDDNGAVPVPQGGTGATTPQAALAALGAMAADATGADIPVSSSDQTPISASLSNKIGVPIQIPAHADLNDYTTAGLYYAGADDIVATISNCPTTHAFSLFVEKGANADPIQTLKAWKDLSENRAAVYIRSGYPDWGFGWEKYVFAISPQVDPLTLYSGWTAWRACQFFKTQENVVVVSFQVKTESPKSGEINIASLPVGFRPKIASGENGAIGADGSCTVDGKYAGADIVVYQDGRITGYNAVGAAQHYAGHIVFEAET